MQQHMPIPSARIVMRCAHWRPVDEPDDDAGNKSIPREKRAFSGESDKRSSALHHVIVRPARSHYWLFGNVSASSRLQVNLGRARLLPADFWYPLRAFCGIRLVVRERMHQTCVRLNCYLQYQKGSRFANWIPIIPSGFWLASDRAN